MEDITYEIDYRVPVRGDRWLMVKVFGDFYEAVDYAVFFSKQLTFRHKLRVREVNEYNESKIVMILEGKGKC